MLASTNVSKFSPNAIIADINGTLILMVLQYAGPCQALYAVAIVKRFVSSTLHNFFFLLMPARQYKEEKEEQDEEYE